MAITVPPVRGAGDLGHVDDSNIVRQALLDLDAADAAIVQAAGNLLTANQASLEDGATTGWAAVANCSLAASTTYAAHGAYSLRVTHTAGTSLYAATTVVPVSEGRLYSVVLSWREGVANGNSAQIIVEWLNAGGSVISSSTSASMNGTTSFQEFMVSAVAPSGAVNAKITFGIPAGLPAASGRQFYLDMAGLWEGYGGTWALPGQPIQGIGQRWDAAGVWMWDTFENRETLVVARPDLPPRATALPAGGA